MAPGYDLSDDEKMQMRNANGQEILKYAQQQGISPAVAMERLGLLGNLNSEKLLSSQFLQKKTSEMFGLSGVDFAAVPQITSPDMIPAQTGVFSPTGGPSPMPAPTSYPMPSAAPVAQSFEGLTDQELYEQSEIDRARMSDELYEQQLQAEPMIEIIEGGKSKKIPASEWASIIKAAQNSPPLEINYASRQKEGKSPHTYSSAKEALMDWATNYFAQFTEQGDLKNLWRITNKNPEYEGFWKKLFNSLQYIKNRMEDAKDQIPSKELLQKMNLWR